MYSRLLYSTSHARGVYVQSLINEHRYDSNDPESFYGEGLVLPEDAVLGGRGRKLSPRQLQDRGDSLHPDLLRDPNGLDAINELGSGLSPVVKKGKRPRRLRAVDPDGEISDRPLGLKPSSPISNSSLVDGPLDALTTFVGDKSRSHVRSVSARAAREDRASNVDIMINDGSGDDDRYSQIVAAQPE